MYSLYSFITQLISPLMPLVLRRRMMIGKENELRVQERLGEYTQLRPHGKLLWIHAASVGESNAVLQLIHDVLEAHAALSVLITTVTVTSAQLLQDRLPPRAIHQFVPVDTPDAVSKFLSHWHPDVALWVDSEFWPNLIVQTHKTGARLGLVNARMSKRSYQRWHYAKALSEAMLSCFSFCFAQSEEDAERLKALGLKVVSQLGNLKYDASPLPYHESELRTLKEAVGNRPVWLAASTHDGEETLIANAHKQLSVEIPHLLTIIVPRHSSRGDAIAKTLHPVHIAQRSQHEPIEPHTAIYLADTMGELGLFYRLALAAFIGGSLVPHGGQNPLEAAKLGVAIVYGPHMENFATIAKALEAAGGAVMSHEEQLATTVSRILRDDIYRKALSQNAFEHLETHGGVRGRIMKTLQPYIA